MAALKILHVSDNSYPTRGGVERVVHELARRQAEHGHEVIAISRTNSILSGSEEFVVDKVKYVKFSTILFPLHGRAVFSAFRPDVVHLNSYLASGWFKKNRGAVIVRHVHDVLGSVTPSYLGAGVGALLPPFEARALRGFDNYVVPSSSTAKKLRAVVGPSAKIWRIPNGVDTNTFKPYAVGWLRNSLKICRSEKLILFAGRVAVGKGALDALKASIPSLLNSPSKLVFLGPVNTGSTSGQKSALKLILETARREGVERKVSIVPPVDDLRFAQALSEADILVLPSVSEGFGLIVLEAAACGTPSLVYPSGSLPEVIVRGVTGWITTKPSCQELGTTLLEVLSDDESLTRASAKCVEYASKFDWEKVYERMQAVYGEIGCSLART